MSSSTITVMLIPTSLQVTSDSRLRLPVCTIPLAWFSSFCVEHSSSLLYTFDGMQELNSWKTGTWFVEVLTRIISYSFKKKVQKTKRRNSRKLLYKLRNGYSKTRSVLTFGCNHRELSSFCMKSRKRRRQMLRRWRQKWRLWWEWTQTREGKKKRWLIQWEEKKRKWWWEELRK